jgi:hypothetical protein
VKRLLRHSGQHALRRGDRGAPAARPRGVETGQPELATPIHEPVPEVEDRPGPVLRDPIFARLDALSPAQLLDLAIVMSEWEPEAVNRALDILEDDPR